MTKQATLAQTNEIVTIVATNGGWTTIQLPDGSEKKVRNGALTVVIGEDRRKCDHDTVVVAAPSTSVTKPETVKKEPKMEAQAAEVKKSAPPVREARPAHFVGEVAAGKVAKIKDTTFDLSRYYVSDIKTPTGRRTIDCADDVAARLRGLTIEEVYSEAAEVLGATVEALQAQYGHLNVGMQRMNLGNRIRGAAKAREEAAKREQNIAERAAQREQKEAAKAEAKARKESEKAAKRAEKEAAKAKKAEAAE